MYNAFHIDTPKNPLSFPANQKKRDQDGDNGKQTKAMKEPTDTP
ncbi:hypothetical protein EVA_09173 [gut metagenome]|uniref:Uncharacterized protein n=1 Tax=gut metagenome TaxID=749906 RepID=J9CRB6_9ZZZZ